MSSDFFYRFEGFDLTPGNKTAGFVMWVAAAPLALLGTIPVSTEEWETLRRLQHVRVQNSGLVLPDALSACGMRFHAESAIPLMFTTDPALGGSLGANPADLIRVLDADGEDYLGLDVEYTPHNVDTPAQAMVLMILALAWAEWAHLLLARLQVELAARGEFVPLPEGAKLMTLEEFFEYEDMGALDTDGGAGFYATATQMGNVPLTELQPAWATHVVWFGR